MAITNFNKVCYGLLKIEVHATGILICMNVSLTPELDEFVRKKVESGMYLSASEVIREALRLLDEQDKVRQVKLTELRGEIAQGIEQAERGELNEGKEVFKKLRKRAGDAKTNG